MPERVIEIRPEVFGCGYDVRVVPPVIGVSRDREFPDYGEALDYALGLRDRMGWRVIDLAGVDE